MRAKKYSHKSHETYRYTTPAGRRYTDNCVAHAVSNAEGRDYDEVIKQLRELTQKTGAKKFNSYENFESYFRRRKGYKKQRTPDLQKVQGFCEKNQSGIFFLIVKNGQVCRAPHATVVIDGVNIDWFDCSGWRVVETYKVDREAMQEVKTESKKYKRHIANAKKLKVRDMSAAELRARVRLIEKHGRCREVYIECGMLEVKLINHYSDSGFHYIHAEDYSEAMAGLKRARRCESYCECYNC